MNLDIVIMAAGKGTRMNSELPKVLHSLAGRPMIQHVLETANKMAPNRLITVIGYRGEMVQRFAEHLHMDRTLYFANQSPQLGTGHAVQQAAPYLSSGDGVTIVLNGDVPLIKVPTLSEMYCGCAGVRLALLTVFLEDPTGYGRIVRNDQGKVIGIVEHKDATEEQRAIKEVYTGILSAPTQLLKHWLGGLTNDNAQAEYYLTDVVAAAVRDGVDVITTQPLAHVEVLGVNSPQQLAELEAMMETV